MKRHHGAALALCLGLTLAPGLSFMSAAVLPSASTADVAQAHRTLKSSPVTLTLYANRSAARINPAMFGLMFEDINHSGDGGIYAELIRNRALLDNAGVPLDWATVLGARSAGAESLDPGQPLTHALSTSLRLTIARVGAGGRVGVANDGYYGIPVWPRTTYHASFYAKGGAGFGGPLTVSLESMAGRVYAAATVPAITHSWRRYAVTLTTRPGIAPSQANRFVIAATHTGTLWLDLVSLFPPTWNGRRNGLRLDLMRELSALHPGFLRFPGGNFLEGQLIATRFEWKNTIGDLAGRPGHLDPWGYYSSDGLGLLEYLEWCQDLHVIPVLAVYAGYSLDGEAVPAGPRLRPYVQDALDEIQYATGPSSTVWGARRAADGHPAPFAVPYVEVGNEDFFDNSGSYDGRFSQFYDAIRAAYPRIKLIATATVHSRTPDVYDQHFYQTPDWFAANGHYYDTYSRRAPKVFVGEYAAQTAAVGQGAATLGAALGEAVWMTGLERNADVVLMAAYAPLFQNVNDYQWSPDLISYDSLNSYGSPSYYVQQMFSLNHGDVVVPCTLSSGLLAAVASKSSRDGTLYLTVVNRSAAAQAAHIAIEGSRSVAALGTATVLTSAGPDDQNSLAAPRHVAPVMQAVRGLGRAFTYTFRPYSVTVLRLAG